MVFKPRTIDEKYAYTLWVHPNGQSVSYPGNININSFHDMKRFYVLNKETKKLETPFYNEELERAYDPVTNPQPHMELLHRYFNKTYLDSNEIYVFNAGDTKLRKLVRYDENSHSNYIGTPVTEQFEKDLEEGLKARREQEIQYETVQSEAEQLLASRDEAMEVYKEFFGPNRLSKEQVSQLEYRTLNEGTMYMREDLKFTDPNPSKEELGDITEEQFTLLTMAAGLTTRSAIMEKRNGRPVTNEDKQAEVAFFAAFSTDSIALQRSGYSRHKANDLARQYVKEAVAGIRQNDYSTAGRLLAEGLNNWSRMVRTLDYADKKSLLNRITQANGYPKLKLLEILDANPRLMKAARDAGLSSSSLTLLRSNAAVEKMDREHLTEIAKTFQTNVFSAEKAHENMRRLAADSIIMNIAQKDLADQEAKNMPTAISVEDMEFATGYGYLKNEPLDTERILADPAKLEAMRIQIMKTPAVWAEINNKINAIDSPEKLREFVKNKEFAATVKLTENQRHKLKFEVLGMNTDKVRSELEFAGFTAPEKSANEKQLDAFYEARKDMVTFNTQMDVLLSRHSLASSEFKQLIRGARSASVFPATKEDLVRDLETLKAAAEHYIHEKDTDIVGRHLTNKANRLHDYGQERYKYAQLVVKVCTKHLETLGQLRYPENFSPETAADRETKLKPSMIKQLAADIRHKPFNAVAFSKYMILHNLEETGNSDAIRKMYLSDLNSQAKIMAESDALKMMQKVITEEFSVHEQVAFYQAAKKYAADFKTEKDLHPFILASITADIKAGNKRYLHKCGNAEVDQNMKKYALDKLEAISNVKSSLLSMEFRKAVPEKNDNFRILHENLSVIPAEDRNTSVNEFSTERSAYGSAAICLMIRNTPVAERQALLENLLTGKADAAYRTALKKAHNLLKYGENSDREMNGPATAEQSLAGKREVASLSAEAFPLLEAALKDILNVPSNNLAEAKFPALDKAKILLIRDVLFDLDQELTRVKINNQPLNAGNTHLHVICDFANCAATTMEHDKYKGFLIDAFNTENPENTALAQIIGQQIGSAAMLKKHSENLNRFKGMDLTNPVNVATVNAMHTDFMGCGNLIAMAADAEKYSRFCSAMSAISHEKKDLELLMPFIADGSFAKSMNPVYDEQNTLVSVNVPDSREAVMKWVTERYNALQSDYRKTADAQKNTLTKLSEKAATPEAKQICAKGIHAMARLNAEGFIPPAGILPLTGRRTERAKELLTDLLKAECYSTCIQNKVPENTALQNTAALAERNEVRKMVEPVDLSTVQNFVMNKGIQHAVQQYATVQAVRNNEPVVNQL